MLSLGSPVLVARIVAFIALSRAGSYAVGVSAGIVVGQLQHHRVINPNQMNYLKRRFDWEQIELALAR